MEPKKHGTPFQLQVNMLPNSERPVFFMCLSPYKIITPDTLGSAKIVDPSPCPQNIDHVNDSWVVACTYSTTTAAQDTMGT